MNFILSKWYLMTKSTYRTMFYVTISRLIYRQYFLDRIGSNLEWSYTIMTCLTVLYFIVAFSSEPLNILYFCVYKWMCLKQCTSLLKLEQITLYCTMQWKKSQRVVFLSFEIIPACFFSCSFMSGFKKN